MKLLTTIYRQGNINLAGKTFLRDSIRGIILRSFMPQPTPESELLMIYSTAKGDYKFPGGGRNADESHLDALKREILEEAGATLTHVHGEFGKVLEYGKAKEPGFETFKMFSYYYLCEVGESLVAPTLEAYEARLGFTPVWVSIAEALRTNQRLAAEASPSPRWTRREIFVLAALIGQSHLL